MGTTTTVNVTSTSWTSTGITSPCMIQLTGSQAVELAIGSTTPSLNTSVQLKKFGKTIDLTTTGTLYVRLLRAGSSIITVTPIDLGSGGGASNPNGQATMADSAPVVIASDQTAVPVTLDSFSLSALENITIDNTELASIDSKLPTSIVDMPSQDTPSLPVRISPQKYIDISFSQTGSGLLSPELTQIAAGSGMTVSQANGNLVILSGTTANAEFVARSANSFNGALTLRAAFQRSQHIVNNNFYYELVDVIGDGLAYNIVNTTTVDVTKTAHGYTAKNVGQRIDLCALSSVGVPMDGVIASLPDANTIRFTVAGYPASGSGTLSLTGWNKIELQFQGVSATASALGFNTRRRGWQNTQVLLTQSNVANGNIVTMNTDNGAATVSDSVATSAAALIYRANWNSNIPLPETVLYLQIRCKNGTTAPASTTAFTTGFARIEDYTPLQANLTNIRPQGSNTLPVVVNSGTVTTVSTVTAVTTVTTVTGVTTVSAVTSANLGIPTLVADVASAALTTTTTTAAVTPTFGTTYVVNIPVIVVTGTTPTLDIGVEESDDTGTNWYRVYDFPRITATGSYRSPPLTLRGNRIRYVQTVTGTTPSFTRAINRLQRSDDAPMRTQFIDRTIVLNTLNSVTPAYYIEGCKDFNLNIRVVSQASAATLALQFSADGTNWLTSPTTVATVAGMVQAKYTNEQWKFCRATVTVAGTTVVLGEVTITGSGS